VPVRAVTGTEYAQAVGAFHDDLAAHPPRIVHRGQPELDAAVAAARRRDRGDVWTWDRRVDTDVSPLIAVTLARWAAVTTVTPAIY
jgi:hypothetical protein